LVPLTPSFRYEVCCFSENCGILCEIFIKKFTFSNILDIIELALIRHPKGGYGVGSADGSAVALKPHLKTFLVNRIFWRRYL